jgi:hypothetical protein
MLPWLENELLLYCPALRCRCRPDPRRAGLRQLDVLVGLPID